MNKTHINNFDIDTWYQQPLGNKILAVEKQQLQLLPRETFGHSLLQLGAPMQRHWLNIYNAPHHIVSANKPAFNCLTPTVQTHYMELPFPDNSFTTVILPHTLEFSAKPKKIIQEAWAVLAPEGHLIVIGFNPTSLNNIWSLGDKTVIGLPAWTKFQSIHKIYHWLRNDHYELVYLRNFIYLPFVYNKCNLKNWFLLEKMAAWLLPACGSIYILVLKKRITPLIPLRLRWHWRELLQEKDLREPAAGNIHRE